MYGKKESSPEVAPKEEGQSFFTTEEKAQYEIFRNGELPRETIELWIRRDLQAMLSFVHGTLNDERIFSALVDVYFERYARLHGKEVSDGNGK